MDLIDVNLLDQISTLVWAHSGDTALAEKIAGVRIVADLWSKLSNEREMDALRAATIMNISKYVKDNPRVTKEEMKKEVERQIADFAKKVEQM